MRASGARGDLAGVAASMASCPGGAGPVSGCPLPCASLLPSITIVFLAVASRRWVRRVGCRCCAAVRRWAVCRAGGTAAAAASVAAAATTTLVDALRVRTRGCFSRVGRHVPLWHRAVSWMRVCTSSGHARVLGRAPFSFCASTEASPPRPTHSTEHANRLPSPSPLQCRTASAWLPYWPGE